MLTQCRLCGGRLAPGAGAARLRGPWRKAEEERMGAMEGAGAGVWPGLVAEPRSLDSCPEVV